MSSMQYEDTHASEDQLSRHDGNAFDMVMICDESVAPPRYVFSTPPIGVPYAKRAVWRRLVVHVADAGTPEALQRVIDALGVNLHDVPF
jgi:hypothetical protein